MASIPDSRFPYPTAAAEHRAGGLLRRLAAAFLSALADYRARRALLAMSDAQLKDIGLSRADFGPTERGAIDWADLQRRRDGRGL